MTNATHALFAEHARAARSRRRLADEELFESQRGRLLQAVVSCVAEKGYVPVTIADVVSRAAISRNTFYEHFTDKEQCFLTALQTGGTLIAQDVLAVEPDPSDWEAGTRARIRTLLETLQELPSLARCILLEAPGAGHTAAATVSTLVKGLATVLADEQEVAREIDASLPPISPRIFHMAVGGLVEVIRVELLEGRDDRLAELEDDMVRMLRIVHDAGQQEDVG